MSTARTFRLAWKLSKITPMRIAWIIFTRVWMFPFWLAGAMWGLIATEDRYTHLWNTYHGGAQFMLWFPGVAAMVLGFAGLIWLVILVLDNPFDGIWDKED